MRLSIAAGILAVTSLPLEAAVAPHSTFAEEGMIDRLVSMNRKNGIGGKRIGRFAASLNKNGRIIKNLPKECEPTSLTANADVGVLSCGLGQYCEESASSKLGGVCRRQSSPHVRSLESHRNRKLEDGFDISMYCDIGCDCSGFDLTTNLGIIDCPPTYSCYESCDPVACVGATLFVNFSSVTDYMLKYCITYEGDVYTQELCYNGGSAGTELISLVDGVACNYVKYDNNCTGVIFDCTNTARGDAGSECDGDSFYPGVLGDDCAENRTTYVCPICSLGYNITLPDATLTGSDTCQDGVMMSLMGFIGPESCAEVTSLAAANCGCEAGGVPPTESSPPPVETSPPGEMPSPNGSPTMEPGSPPSEMPPTPSGTTVAPAMTPATESPTSMSSPPSLKMSWSGLVAVLSLGVFHFAG